jgi:lipopolysaccharide export system protein LptC
VSIYLPVLMMGLLAMGTYWLVKNTPLQETPDVKRPLTHDPDYTMSQFAVRSFDAAGKLKSELFGKEARHYPDTDTLEIDQVRMRSFNAQGQLTTANADRALSNGDASEVQLFGNAVVMRQGATAQSAATEFRGDFLHAFVNTERLFSNKPVTLVRGRDTFTADSLRYDNVDRVAELQGRVRGVLAPAGSR